MSICQTYNIKRHGNHFNIHFCSVWTHTHWPHALIIVPEQIILQPCSVKLWLWIWLQDAYRLGSYYSWKITINTYEQFDSLHQDNVSDSLLGCDSEFIVTCSLRFRRDAAFSSGYFTENKLQLELDALYINIRSMFFPFAGLFSYAMQLNLPPTYSSSNTLKFEAVISTEKSVTNYLSTWRLILFINKAVRTTNRTLFWKLKYPLKFISYVWRRRMIYHEITRIVISQIAYVILLESKWFSAHFLWKESYFSCIELFENALAQQLFWNICWLTQHLRWKNNLRRIQSPSFIMRLTEE